MDRGREGRIHQHDARRDAGIEVVVDVSGVKPRRADGGKEQAKNAGSTLGELVEDKGSAGQVGEDGKEACARRWFHDNVRGRERSSDTGDKCQPYRCRELPERFTFFGPTSLGRKE